MSNGESFIEPGANLVGADNPLRTRFATLERTEIRSRWNTAKGRAILAKWKQAGFGRDAVESLVGKFDGHIDLRGIPLRGEKLSGANLTEADLYSADLEGADLSRSDLRNSYFSEANIKGTRFDWAAMQGVYLDNVEYDTKTSFLGIDLATINFNLAALLRDLAITQQRISHLEKRNPMLALFLRLTSEYGLSLSRYLCWVGGIIIAFGALYAFIPGLTSKPGMLNGLYFSVVTFTTLGYGDIIPASGWGQVLAIVEVCTGYLMGGLLVTILARRLLLG
jgi:Ion channel/Pentapeptide repeats (8 copies)